LAIVPEDENRQPIFTFPECEAADALRATHGADTNPAAVPTAKLVMHFVNDLRFIFFTPFAG
tara:strand:+ start:4187 stop:4372 length:186 start_codon:yes stop_codon:yes gene_type:complete